jgi:hypothetical protein
MLSFVTDLILVFLLQVAVFTQPGIDGNENLQEGSNYGNVSIQKSSDGLEDSAPGLRE